MTAAETGVQCLYKQLPLERNVPPRRKPVANVCLLLLLFVALAAQLWIRVATTQQGYALEELRTQTLEKDALLRELKVEFASITRPAILTARAKQELALIPLTPERVRRIELTTDTRLARLYQ